MDTQKRLVLCLCLWLHASISLAGELDLMQAVHNETEITSLAHSEALEKLMDEGKKREANQKIVAMLKDSQNPAKYFIVANLLYQSDKVSSLQLMNKANEFLPNNAYIEFELAMRKHRDGVCEEALPLYEKAVTQLPNTPKIWAYITHCNLRLGRADAAIKAWQKVDVRNHDVAIESAMFDVFEREDEPDIRREDLLNKIKMGDAGAICDLVKLDKSWPIDWWNATEKKEYLSRDIKFAAPFIKNDDDRDVIEASCTSDADDVTKQKNLTAILNSKNKLPKSLSATKRFLVDVISYELITPQEALTRFEDELMVQFKENPQRQEPLDLLTYLYQQTNETKKLRELDSVGWQERGLAIYAASYISQVSSLDAKYLMVLEQASDEFPNSAAIQAKYWEYHQNTSKKNQALMRYIAALFPSVKGKLGGALKIRDFMALLSSEIAKK